MARKNFKENPALQFISAGEEINTQNTQNTEDTYNTQNTEISHKTQNENNTEENHNTEDTYAAYSVSNTHNTQHKEKAHNTQHTHELKKKRLNLILRNSVFDDLAKVAYMKKTSVNNLINNILREYLDSESDTVARYMEIFKR